MTDATNAKQSLTWAKTAPRFLKSRGHDGAPRSLSRGTRPLHRLRAPLVLLVACDALLSDPNRLTASPTQTSEFAKTAHRVFIGIRVAFYAIVASALVLVGTAPASAQTPALSGISFVSSPASGDTYTRGELVRVRVEFDGDVEVSNLHLLKLALTVGTVTKQLEPSLGAQRHVIFSSTVQASDRDTDGISVPANPLTLNGGAITVPGDPSTEAVLLHAGVDNDAAHKVNGTIVVAPTVTRVSVVSFPRVGDTFLRGEKISLAVTFDKDVSVRGSPKLALTIGTNERQADLTSPVSTSSPSVWFQYTVEATDLDTDGISFPQDAVSLNGGAIELADGTIAADITHSAVPADPDSKVNGILLLPPTVERVYVGFGPENSVAYQLGEEIRARAQFDRPVEVSGRPQLALTIGTRIRQATFSKILGSVYMEFVYTAQVSDMDADGISIAADALTRNGGSIRGADRVQDALLTHAAADDDPDHKVDASLSVRPEVLTVEFLFSPESGDTYKRGEPIFVTVNFSGMAEVTGSPRVALTIGSNTRYASYHSVGTPRPFRLRFSYTVQASDTDSDGASIPPNALEFNGGAITLPGQPDIAAVLTHSAVDNDATRKVDGTAFVAPTVTSVTLFGAPISGTVYTVGEMISAYVQFDRPVDATGPQLALEIGTHIRQAEFIEVWKPSPSYVLFAYTVQPSDMDDDGVAIPANALASNGTITLRGDASVAAIRSHGAAAAATNKMVDGSIASAPEVLSVQFMNTPSSGDAYALGEAIKADVLGGCLVRQAGGRDRRTPTGAEHRGQYPAGRVRVHCRTLGEILVQRAGLGHGRGRDQHPRQRADPQPRHDQARRHFG